MSVSKTPRRKDNVRYGEKPRSKSGCKVVDTGSRVLKGGDERKDIG
jgi:hypothetical protein